MTSTETPARKYALIRLRAGDYVLPSNDAQTLWRLATYVEEGSLVHVYADGSERTIRGEFWALWRRPMPPEDSLLDPDEWDGWEHWAGPLPSRREAIELAMRQDRSAAVREP